MQVIPTKHQQAFPNEVLQHFFHGEKVRLLFRAGERMVKGNHKVASVRNMPYLAGSFIFEGENNVVVTRGLMNWSVELMAHLPTETCGEIYLNITHDEAGNIWANPTLDYLDIKNEIDY